MKPKFAVVVFPDEASIEVASSQWLNASKTVCSWPRVKNIKFLNLVTSHALPGVDRTVKWTTYPCRVLGTYASYAEAEKRCARGEYTSNIDSTAEQTPSIVKPHKRIPVLGTKKRRLHIPNSKTSSGSSFGSASPSASSSKGKSAAAPKLPGIPFLYSVTDTPAENSFHHSVSLQLTPPNKTVLHSDNQLLSPSENGASSEAESRSGSQDNRTTFAGVAGSTSQAALTTSNSQGNSGTGNNSAPQANFTDFYRTQSPLPSNRNVELATVLSEIQQELRRMNENHARFQETVLSKILTLERNLKELVNTTVTTKESTLEDINFNLPVADLPALESLKTWLTLPDNFSKLVRYLSVVGGSGVKDITYRILSELLTDSVGVQISYTGHGSKSKAGLKDTSVMKFLYEAVRKTKGGETATNQEVSKSVKDWLKNAGDRSGGREKRRRELLNQASQQQQSS